MRRGLTLAILVIALAVFTTACPSGDDRRTADGGPADGALDAGGKDGGASYRPAFRTDFEPANVQGAPSDVHDALSFTVNLGDPSTSDLALGDPLVFGMYYEGGTAADRYARLVPDPVDPENQVLLYWMRNATIDAGYQNHTKGRIQTGLRFGEEGGVIELYEKHRMMLHPDLAALLTYPTTGDPWWPALIIQSWWFGGAWEGHQDPSRVSVMVYADPTTGVLRMAASLNDDSETFWTLGGAEVPTGGWLTMEVGYRQGDATSGRFVIRLRPETEDTPTTVVDLTGHTYNPHADEAGGSGPVPLTHWQPLKLYGSDNSLHHVRDSGPGWASRIYWDDLEFGDRWPDGWPQ